jgi:lysophospholipase L1-like esterase
VVTLHIGGNDVTNPIIQACLGGVSPACLEVVEQEFADFRADLDHVLSALREAAGPDTPIVIGTYDNPIPHCELGPVPGASLLGAMVLEGSSAVPGGPIEVGLHDIIRELAAEHDGLVAEVFGQLAPADWVGGGDCLHPVASGYDKVADAFLDALGLG